MRSVDDADDWGVQEIRGQKEQVDNAADVVKDMIYPVAFEALIIDGGGDVRILLTVACQGCRIGLR